MDHKSNQNSFLWSSQSSKINSKPTWTIWPRVRQPCQTFSAQILPAAPGCWRDGWKVMPARAGQLRKGRNLFRVRTNFSKRKRAAGWVWHSEWTCPCCISYMFWGCTPLALMLKGNQPHRWKPTCTLLWSGATEPIPIPCSFDGSNKYLWPSRSIGHKPSAYLDGRSKATCEPGCFDVSPAQNELPQGGVLDTFDAWFDGFSRVARTSPVQYISYFEKKWLTATFKILHQRNGPLTFPDLADLGGACCHNLVHPLDHNTGLQWGRGTGWVWLGQSVGYLILNGLVWRKGQVVFKIICFIAQKRTLKAYASMYIITILYH